MSVRENPFETIALKEKEAIGDGAEPARLERHEQMLLSLLERRKERKTDVLRILLPVAAALAAAAVIAIFLNFSDRRESLSFTVGEQNTPSEIGTWISSTQGQTTDIRFATGSRFRLMSGGAARVVAADEDVVELELSRGTLGASVKGDGRTKWRVKAGPFTVTVLGTQFEVKWINGQDDLQVKVTHGVVLVQGATLQTHGVRLSAGTVLATSNHGGSYTVRSTDSKEIAASGNTAPGRDKTPDNTASTSTKNSPLSKSEGSKTATRPGADTRAAEWSEPCGRNEFDACTGAAISRGIPTVLATATLDQLWALAEAARNTGKPSLSNDALVSLRTRFKSTPKARLAAFIIGRSAMDNSGMNDLAAQWFATYLKESPSGQMAEEAMGRLMTTYSKMGRADLARETAEEYLRRFPGGLYENKARSMHNSAR